MRAAYLVAHEAKGGLPVLARLLKKSPTTLAHEVNPPAGSMAKLGLATAVQLTEATNDDRILHAWAEARGYRLVRAHVPANDSHGDLLQAVCRFGKESGEALTAMHRAIDAGHITENDIARFEREVGDVAPAAVSLAARMRALALTQAKDRATLGWQANKVAWPQAAARA